MTTILDLVLLENRGMEQMKLRTFIRQLLCNHRFSFVRNLQGLEIVDVPAQMLVKGMLSRGSMPVCTLEVKEAQ